MPTVPVYHTFSRKVKAAILSLCVIFAYTASASALVGLYRTSSVEWLTCSSEVVAVGKLQSVNTVSGSGDIVYDDCVLIVSEMFKGPPTKELKFGHRRFPQEKNDWAKVGGEVLVFLSPSDPEGDRRMTGVLSPVNYPYTRPFPIFDLARLPTLCVDKDLNILPDPQKVLALVRTWSVSKIAHFVELDAPEDLNSPLGRELAYSRHKATIEVPAEEKYRAKYEQMAKSEKPGWRSEAADNLLKYPGPETERILRELLKDESSVVSMDSEEDISKLSFFVRQSAFSALESLGVQVTKPLLERAPTVEELRAHRTQRWQSLFQDRMRGEWKVESVADGASLQLDGKASTSLLVTCSKEGRTYQFTLVPRLWSKKQFPKGENLGVIMGGTNSGRSMFVDGELSQTDRAYLKKQFGLKAAKR